MWRRSKETNRYLKVSEILPEVFREYNPKVNFGQWDVDLSCR
jgi:hypothetical protein